MVRKRLRIVISFKNQALVIHKIRWREIMFLVNKTKLGFTMITILGLVFFMLYSKLDFSPISKILTSQYHSTIVLTFSFVQIPFI